MAVMSRKKRAIAQNWDAIDKKREEANKPINDEVDKKISLEEHDKRVKYLKELGLIKD